MRLAGLLLAKSWRAVRTVPQVRRNQVIPAEAVEAAARLFVAQVASMMKRYEERKSKIKMKAAA